MYEKRKALTHEYPSKHEEFEKWGFDPKQYHHIIRLSHILQHINNSFSYMVYDDYLGKDMIEIKRNTIGYTKQFVEKDSDEIIERSKKMIPEDYKYEEVDLSDEIGRYIEKEIKKELYNTG